MPRSDFSEPAKSTAAAGPSTAPAPDPADPVDLESEDFLAEFTRNMRALLSEQPEAPAAPREAPEGGATHEATEPLSKDEEDKIRKYFTEALEKDFGLSGLEGEPGAANNPGAGISEQDLQDVLGMVDGRFKGPEPSTSASSQPGASQKTGPARPDSFQDTLRATAERLKASEQSARVSGSTQLEMFVIPCLLLKQRRRAPASERLQRLWGRVSARSGAFAGQPWRGPRLARRR